MKKVFAVLIVTILLLVMLVMLAFKNVNVFLLPEGYTGWIQVTYEQEGYPELKREGWNFMGRDIVYPIPPSGELKTSSRSEVGMLRAYYINQDGKRVKMKDNSLHFHSGSTVNGVVLSRFFVGTREQFELER